MLIEGGSRSTPAGVDRVREVIQEPGFDSRTIPLARSPLALGAFAAREEETVA
jgi:hypothetical protein